MSIFDVSVQDDWVRDNLIAKIKAAEKKYYNESPCLHCGPGNGCDDCRGCEDSKRNYELEMMLHNAREAYKNRFGHSYDEDLMIQQIVNKEKEVEHWRDHCKKCGGNFGDNCPDCSELNKIIEVSKSLNWLKEEFKRKYQIDYDKLNKQELNKSKKVMDNKKYLKFDKGTTIKEWIDYNIRTYGAKNFFECVNTAWDEMSNSVKEAMLDEIQTKIKPEKIDTIEDLAKLLDGNEYGGELQNEYGINIHEICEKKGWIIAYGASDDLLEIEGAIRDELGANDGSLVQFYKKGSFYPEYDEEDVYHKAKEDIFYPIDELTLKKTKETNYKDTVVIESLWCPEGTDMSWQINVAGAPCVKFNVMEDEEVYCEAAIIDMSKFLTK